MTLFTEEYRQKWQDSIIEEAREIHITLTQDQLDLFKEGYLAQSEEAISYFYPFIIRKTHDGFTLHDPLEDSPHRDVQMIRESLLHDLRLNTPKDVPEED
jgi:hypothetical protein